MSKKITLYIIFGIVLVIHTGLDLFYRNKDPLIVICYLLTIIAAAKLAEIFTDEKK